MGEWSKRIGEYGENLVEKILSVVGWTDLQKGIEIKCSNEEHTNTKGKPLKTHGIDFLYSYLSPLVDGQLNNVIISSKFQAKKYPNNPTAKFKDFMKDLIHTIDCFDNSTQKENVIQGFNFTSVNSVGVLFWLNNDETSTDDLIAKVAAARLDAIRDNSIYIIDNKRACFILTVMSFVKSNPKYKYSFWYPSTGRNVNPQERPDTGTFLPVEYLNSSIIPIKLENKDNHKETCLLLASVDNFETDECIRLMGLAKDISKNLVGEVILAFPDYNELKHKNDSNQAKQSFEDKSFTDTVKVKNYKDILGDF
ncbi:GapS4a family protein [Treponema vincentii]|uniref:GapS4a family protein n=1 Tax=Treponema vincentii TaxID=69710 RepID=UPI003D9032CB